MNKIGYPYADTKMVSIFWNIKSVFTPRKPDFFGFTDWPQS